MTLPSENPRQPEAKVDRQFVDRWSPRAFREEPLAPDDVSSLLEAARWAPSSANEQPWLWLYATQAEDRERFASALVDANRVWAAKAPLLLFLASRRHWRSKPTEANATAGFDCGAAWMALALQAQRLGLHSHAMAGFGRDKAHEVLGLPEADFMLWVAIAVGRRAEASSLPAHLQAREAPSPRRSLTQISMEGRYRPGVEA